MAYSKEKLKNDSDEAAPCFTPLYVGNALDRFLTTQTLYGFRLNTF
jgi:hypothetical protein